MFSTHSDIVNGYAEETLALAIVLTAFVALLVGFFLGIFVTRQCSSAGQTPDLKMSGGPDGCKYEVTAASR